MYLNKMKLIGMATVELIYLQHYFVYSLNDPKKNMHTAFNYSSSGKKINNVDQNSVRNSLPLSPNMVLNSTPSGGTNLNVNTPSKDIGKHNTFQPNGYTKQYIKKKDISVIRPTLLPLMAKTSYNSAYFPPRFLADTRRPNVSLNNSNSVLTLPQPTSPVVIHDDGKMDMKDMAIFGTYCCAIIAITLPVVLLPLIAADPILSGTISSTVPKLSGSALIASIAGISSFFAASGKFLNCFICQAIGGRCTAQVYLLGVSIFSILLSNTSLYHGLFIGGMEFCFCIMWTASTVMLSNRYQENPSKFAASITCLSLVSTASNFLSKILGTFLLSFMHWRNVARVSGLFSLVGVGMARWLIQEESHQSKEKFTTIVEGNAITETRLKSKSSVSFKKMSNSISSLLRNKLFWMVSFAHSSSFLARSSDKMLGTFIHELTNLPRHVCGSLTSVVTAGFIMGLVTGRKVDTFQNRKDKMNFFTSRYKKAVLFTLLLALCANKTFGAWLGSRALVPTISVASAGMAYSIAYQFYQFPAAFASTFGNDKAVCISFVEGMALMIGTPIWSMMGKLASGSQDGWSLAWVMIACCFAFGGSLIKGAIPTVLRWEKEEQE